MRGAEAPAHKQIKRGREEKRGEERGERGERRVD